MGWKNRKQGLWEPKRLKYRMALLCMEKLRGGQFLPPASPCLEVLLICLPAHSLLCFMGTHLTAGVVSITKYI